LTRRRLAVLLAGLVGITLLLVAAPAQAYDIDDCNSGQLCLFDQKIFEQDFHRYVINDRPSGTCFNIPEDWDNRMDRVYNRTVHSVTFYTGNICNGALTPYPILPGNHANFNAHENANEANSVMFHGSGSGCLSEAPCVITTFNWPHPAPELRLVAKTKPEPAATADECERLHGLCLYDGGTYTGAWYFVNIPTTPSNFCITLPSTWVNRTNSVTINGPSGRSDARFYDLSGCSGPMMEPPGNLVSIYLNTSIADNKVNSVRIRVEQEI
jgi:hypothetical protein